MPPVSIDLTVVLNGHREGIMIHRTLRSVRRSVDYARDAGVDCEIVVVLDRPDRATLEYFGRTELPILRVVEVDCGDPGLARNRGVAEAAGRYVAFVDGDDLISRNWLAEAYAFAERQHQSGRRFVLHPEFNIYFGTDSTILAHVDQESAEWSLGSLFAENYWTALLVARKEELAAIPYRSSCPDAGFGYEDWEWNCLAVGAGMIHKVVPGTWHFIRLKVRGSRNRVAQERDLLIRPLPLFDRLESELPEAPDPDSRRGPGPGSDGGGMEQIVARPLLLAEWRELARVEPELFPTREKLQRYRIWRPCRHEIGDLFGRILRDWGPAPSHVILCERLGEGDAGLAALDYGLALAEAGADVTIVAEAVGQALPSLEGCKGSVRLVHFGEIAANMEPYWRSHLLGRALIQRPPRAIHLIESPLGYEVISSYGSSISLSSGIFATVLQLATSIEGQRLACALPYFDRVAPYLSGLLGNSQAILDWYRDTFGYPANRCRTLRGVRCAPMGGGKPGPRRRSGRPTALWFGEPGHLACPSMLLQIARLRPDWDFVIFQQLTSLYPWPDELEARLLAEPNVSRAASGASLGELSAAADAFLQTSLVEGLGSALIGAAWAKVPVVVPATMAIRELIDEETGYPVDDYCVPDAYAGRLREVMGEPEKTRKRAAKAQRRVKAKFRWATFVEALQSIHGDR